ncbi:unnamed protein product [Sympodiomycopsis kandeliae]
MKKHKSRIKASVFLLTLVECVSIASGRSIGSEQHAFQGVENIASEKSTPYTSLSYEGLRVNSAQHPPSQYLTLTTIPSEELDPSTASLHFSAVENRQWEDVMLRCGREIQGGVEGCEEDDMRADTTTDAECTAVKSTMDGRALFDPSADGCEPLQQLWKQAVPNRQERSKEASETLLSFKTSLKMKYIPTSLHYNETYMKGFWLAHLDKKRALWPLSNEGWSSPDKVKDGYWDGLQPNRIGGLMEDPHFQRSAKPERNDPMHGVDISAARWNLGISLRLPPLPEGTQDQESSLSQATLLPVHAPVGGQVVWVDTYRRKNAPSSLNDEQGWVISIRDEWGFVWSLFGISPYRQHVYVGENIPQGHLIGHVSLRPISSVPRDQTSPADPPEKPPGGDGNPLYPYRYRELRIGVSLPCREWTEWRDPYAQGWTVYNPLHFLKESSTSANPPPPIANPNILFFGKARKEISPVNIPSIFASTSLDKTNSDDEEELVEISGKVEMIIGIQSYIPPSNIKTDQNIALDPSGIYKLEWNLLPLSHRQEHPQSCKVFEEEGSWRTSFEHTHLSSSASLYKHFIPSFTTGNYPWTKKGYAMQFDEKYKSAIFYPFTRTLPTSSNVHKNNEYGVWNTRFENSTGRVTGRGDYLLGIRVWDYWGKSNCFVTKVRLSN